MRILTLFAGGAVLAAATAVAGPAMADIVGTSGDDKIRGTADSDWIEGRAGDDLIRGLGGAEDSLHGNAGNDTVYGGAGLDFINGWSGDDLLHFGTHWDVPMLARGMTALSFARTVRRTRSRAGRESTSLSMSAERIRPTSLPTASGFGPEFAHPF